MNIDWIRQGLQQPGKSKIGLAKALRRSPSVVTSLLDGTRQLKAAEVPIIADYLGMEPPGDIVFKTPGSPTAIVNLWIIGEVAAGVWADPRGDTFEPIPYPVPADPDLGPRDQYLLRVRGTSINRKAPSGSLVRCLSVYAAPRPPQHKDWVVVERRRDGEVELTVKRLSISHDGSRQLWPDSDDPKFQEPIDLGARDGDQIEIVAFALDFITPGTVM